MSMKNVAPHGHGPIAPTLVSPSFDSVTLLGKILGDVAGNLRATSADLGIPYGALRRVLLRETQLSPSFVRRHQLFTKLATVYPKNWDLYGQAFQQSLIPSGLKQLVKAKGKVLRLSWRQRVGALVMELCRRRGGDAAAFASASRAKFLRRSESWQQILSGDPEVNLESFALALQTVCRLYKLGEGNEPELYACARKLAAEYWPIPLATSKSDPAPPTPK